MGRLSRDRRGNTALIFGLALLPIAMAAGAAVDLRRQATSKGHLQEAADAAVLAAVKAYFANRRLPEDQRIAAAQQAADRSLQINIKDYSATVLDVRHTLTIDGESGQAVLTGDGASPAPFGGLFGVEKLKYSVLSEAVAGGRPVEIALLLDNTASMLDQGSSGERRFELMRRASINYVNDVYDLAGDQAKVAVVPWASLVNIRSETVAPPDAAPGSSSGRPLFSDRLSVVSDPRNPGASVSAAALAEMSRPGAWTGCIRSAPGEVRVAGNGDPTQEISDAAPPARWPAAVLESSMGGARKRSECPRWEWRTVEVPDTPPGGGGGPPPPPPSPPPPPKPKPKPKPGPGIQGSLDKGGVMLASWTGGPARFTRIKTVRYAVCVEPRRESRFYECLGNGSPTWHGKAEDDPTNRGGDLNAFYPHTAPDGSVQKCSSTSEGPDRPLVQTGVNRLCASDPNQPTAGGACPWERDAFPGGAPRYDDKRLPISGPSLNCPVPILPLSGNRAQVLHTLQTMRPVPGGTLPDVGLLWGLRTLSNNPYWTRFWGVDTEEKKPAPFKSRQADKIAILLTDGYSETPFNYEGYYGCTRKARWAKRTDGRPLEPPGPGPAKDCWISDNVKAAFTHMDEYDPGRWRSDNDKAARMTESACRRLREEYGVELYYILVDVPDPAALRSAKRCAPEEGHAISTSSGELDAVLADVVQRTLRLTR